MALWLWWPLCSSTLGSRLIAIAGAWLKDIDRSQQAVLVLDIATSRICGGSVLESLFLGALLCSCRGLRAALVERDRMLQHLHQKSFALVFGGEVSSRGLASVREARGATSDVELFAEDVWVPGPSLPDRVSGAASALLAGEVYVVGGVGPDGPRAGVWRLDARVYGGLWQPAPSLTTARVGAALVNIGNALIAIGGHNGLTPLRSVELLLPTASEWECAPHMGICRSHCAAVAMGREVLVMGGYDGVDYLNSTELLRVDGTDPQLQRAQQLGNWVSASPMMSQRSSFTATIFHSSVLALGGDDGWQRLQSSEILSDTTSNWQVWAPLSWRRSGCGSFVLCGRLYVFGGYDGLTESDALEVFDEGSWSRFAQTNMKRTRACASVAAIGFRSNALGAAVQT